MTPSPTLELAGVGVRIEGRQILAGVDWTVSGDERWVMLGRNGSGKTTLVRVASLRLFPTVGTVRVLGERYGQTDIRELRRHIGLTSSSLAAQLRPTITARDAVMSAKYGALEPWWHHYERADERRAEELLAQLDCGHLAGQAFGTLSSGERQRVQLARSLMSEPAVVLLDEPNAGLDLGGREALMASLGELAADPASPPTVLVTHHVDAIPPHYTHALILAEGRVLASGPLTSTLTDEVLSECFAMPLQLSRRGGRWSARAGGRA